MLFTIKTQSSKKIYFFIVLFLSLRINLILFTVHKSFVDWGMRGDLESNDKVMQKYSIEILDFQWLSRSYSRTPWVQIWVFCCRHTLRRTKYDNSAHLIADFSNNITAYCFRRVMPHFLISNKKKKLTCPFQNFVLENWHLSFSFLKWNYF